MNHRINTKRILLFLLALDLCFFVFHVIIELPLYTNVSPLVDITQRQFFLLTVDHSLPEWYQYIKFGVILWLLNRILIRTEETGFVAWWFIYLLLLFDDALKIHETIGRFVASLLTFVAPFNLRLQDVGELLASLALGMFVIYALVWAFLRSGQSFRKSAIDLAMLVAALALFGVGVDLLGPLSESPRYRVSIGTLEDVGEMVVVSVMVWYVYRLYLTTDGFTRYLYEAVPLLPKIVAPFLSLPIMRGRFVKSAETLKTQLKRQQSFVVFILYCAYIAIITWPALGQLGTHIPGDGGDSYVHLWNFEHVRDTLLAGRSPFYTHDIFFPNGVALYTHNFAWLNIAAWLPLQQLLGSEVAYTLLFIAVLLLNAFAGYWLARELTKSTAAAFIAGLIIGGWQYLLVQFTRPNLILITFIPLSMWAILKLTRAADKRAQRCYFWLTVLFVAAVGITRIQLFAISLTLLAPWTIRCLLTAEPTARPRQFRQLAQAYFLAGLLIFPFVFPIVWYQATRDFPQDIFEVSRTKFVDLIAYVLPFPHHPLFGNLVEPLEAKAPFTYFFGLIPTLLVLLGVAYRRVRWFWLIMLISLLILAIGDRLVINGHEYMRMPYSWIKATNIDDFIGNPSRFNALLGIPFGILAAYGTVRLLSRTHSTLKPLLVIAVALLILSEYRTPFQMLSLATPIWYEQLAVEEGLFGIVPIPHARRYSEIYMNYQRLHGKGIIEGHVSRLPREAMQFIESIPLLSYLAENYVTAQETLPPAALNNVTEQFQQLAAADLRYMVIHKALMNPDATEAWRSWLALPPLYEDNEVVVYPTDLTAQAQAVPYVADDIAFVQSVNQTPGKRSNQTLELTAHWIIHDSLAATELCLSIAQTEAMCASFAPPVIEGEWPQLVQTRHRLPIDKTVQPGSNVIEGQFVSEGSFGRIFPFATVEIAGPARQFSLPTPDVAVDVTLADELVLLGYDQPLYDNTSLSITIYWQTRVESAQPAKYFFHVVDQAGMLVAQADAVPRNWGYPTNEWAAGEIVSDTITVDFADQPPATYALSVGMVDLTTLERIEATYPSGEAVPNGAIPLGTVDTR